MAITRKLRLGPQPNIQTTKLTFACPASLKADLDLDLDRYAALHAQTYGEPVDAVTLIVGGVYGSGFRSDRKERKRNSSHTTLPDHL